jgi:hypothetical protein
MTDKYCLDNNNNYNYDAIAYPFTKRFKLKHEPEAAQENKPVQYTADIIVEIKNRDGKVLPIRALLDTGTTATIILREFVVNGRASTNTKKRTKSGKHLEEHSPQIMNHFWISNSQNSVRAKW